MNDALQFGHGGDAVENEAQLKELNQATGGFNSATAVMPWKTQLRSISMLAEFSFNSATAVMPWKTC